MNRRWAYGAVLALAVLLILGTGGFSAISADRGVSVTVAGDDEAYVGYEDTCDGQAFKITITNQFDSDIDDGTVTVGDDEADFGPLSPGEAATITFGNVEHEDPVTVTVEGDGFSAELDRSVPHNCDLHSETGVRFRGEGQANIELDEDGPFNVTYWTLSRSSSELSDGPEDTVEGAVQSPDQGTVVAVYVEATHKTYVHPNLVYENGEYAVQGGQGSNVSTDCVATGEVKPDEDVLEDCP